MNNSDLQLCINNYLFSSIVSWLKFNCLLGRLYNIFALMKKMDGQTDRDTSQQNT